MAAPRFLARPPITEALIDIRAAVPAPLEAFEAFASDLQSEFPKRQMLHGFRSELRVENGKLIPPRAEALGFQGVVLSNADDTLTLRFGPEGFTVNNLKSYIGGERLVTEALRLWSLFARQMHVTETTRIAFRYINRLDLPLQPGDKIETMLAAAPILPDGTPQHVSEFLTRVVARDPELDAFAIITQQLSPTGVRPIILIDIDVFKGGKFSAEAEDLRAILNSLRVVKNRTFFSLLTEEAIAQYV
jgi:uncharacterized protein (TIGR04255 family)